MGVHSHFERLRRPLVCYLVREKIAVREEGKLAAYQFD